MEPDSELGPLVNAQAVRDVQALVDNAVASGAIAAVGETPAGGGPFYPATILTGVTPGSEILHQEIFGQLPQSSSSTRRTKSSDWPTTPNTA